MFSTAACPSTKTPEEKSFVVHIGCGVDSSMNTVTIQRYAQSTGPTTTTTLLYL